MEKLKYLCAKYDITLVSYTEIRESGYVGKMEGIIDGVKGIAFQSRGDNTILYDDKLSNEEINYVIAHELGHIILKHLGLRKEILKRPAEVEADIFAAVFVAMEKWEECKQCI